MTVTAVRKDPETMTMVLTAEFEASPERVWDLWADPRKLERWWGPPTYPATFTRHDLTPGSRVEYHMTGPSGDQPHGYWDVVEADPPRRLVFVDGFAHDDGTPNDDFPRNEGRATIEPLDAGRTPLLGQNIISSTHFEPDFDALRAAATRIVVAAGVESEGHLAYRGAVAAAERLGQEVVPFPGDHGGFLGGEYGQTGDPDAFAAKLRQVLAEA